MFSLYVDVGSIGRKSRTRFLSGWGELRALGKDLSPASLLPTRQRAGRNSEPTTTRSFASIKEASIAFSTPYVTV